MIPLYSPDGTEPAKPLGLPMCQNRLAVPTWSYAMEVHPPARIIELGTYSGGFAIALGLHASQIGCKVTSYEQSIAPSLHLQDLGRFLGITFRDQVDIWSVEGEIAALIKNPGVTYVLCDGGDKPRELGLFAKHLKPGDVIAAHDYNHMEGFTTNEELMAWKWGEITAAEGAQVAAEHGLDPWMQEHFDHAGWLVYRKR